MMEFFTLAGIISVIACCIKVRMDRKLDRQEQAELRGFEISEEERRGVAQ